MTLVTKTITTQTQMAKIWRKVQGTAVDGVNFKTPELMLLKNLTQAKLAASLREVTRPVWVAEDGGVASLAEGAAKARPMSPTVQEISVSLIHLQKQIAISELALMTSARGGDVAVTSQFKAQVQKGVAALGKQVGQYFWGQSDGVLAVTDTDLSGASTTLTLKSGYNQSWITDAKYLANRFRDSEYVIIRDGGSQVSNAIGQITGRSTANGTITVTWSGSAPSDTNNGLTISKANSLDNATDDYNKALVGVMEAMTATSLHGLSGSTYSGWNVASSDSTGGRFDGVRLEAFQDAIEDDGGVTADLVAWSRGVKRDVRAQYSAALEFTDAYKIPIDGKVTAKGIDFFSSRDVPPTFVLVGNKSSVEKFFWNPSIESQDSMQEGDLRESEDYSARIGHFDLVGNLVWNRRKGFAYGYSYSES